MSIDMSQFYQVFFEESGEHLANMESLLLGLDLAAPDDDQLNAIFRAAHSIKGGSGTFGFTDMTEVTHVLETLLDRIRKHEIAITSAMVDAFLEAGDVLHGMLDAHQNGGEADKAAAAEVKVKLERLTGDSGGKAAPVATPPVEAAPAAAAPSSQHTYSIRFAKTPAIFPSEAQLTNLLEDLGNLGKIENQQIAEDSVSLTLTAWAGEAELRDIFSFFLEPEQLTITLQGDAISSSEDGDGYGFFVEPEQIKAGIEDEQGYGFFVEPEQIKADAENAQGYGFFTEVTPPVESAATSANAPAADLAPGETPHRRATDRAAPAAETSIRVSVEKVDQMINLVGELVITQSMLAEIASHLDPVLHESLVSGLAQLELNTRELQESVMSVRMMPINFVFSRFPRLVRDLAGKMNKQVQLKLVGEGTELDKGLIEKISDPLPTWCATVWITASRCRRNALPRARTRRARSRCVQHIRAATSSSK